MSILYNISHYISRFLNTDSLHLTYKKHAGANRKQYVIMKVCAISPLDTLFFPDLDLSQLANPYDWHCITTTPHPLYRLHYL